MQFYSLEVERLYPLRMLTVFAGIIAAEVPEMSFKARLIGCLSDRDVTFSISNVKSKKGTEEFASRTLNGQIDTSFLIKTKGKYRIRISSLGMLTHAFILDLTPGRSVNLGKINAFLGDVNGDNRIDKKDIALIQSFLGVTSSSKVWNTGFEKPPCPAYYCDLNHDNVIDRLDLRIAFDNLGKRGSLR